MNSKQLIPIIVALVLLGGIGVFVLTRGTSTETTNTTPADNTMMDNTMPEGSMMATASGMMETMATGSGSPAAGSVKAFTVTGSNFKFSPTIMSVNRGDRVRVTFKSTSAMHDFMIDEFNVATKQLGANQEETVEFVANQAGTFKYYCSVGNHRAQGMEGTLTVK